MKAFDYSAPKTLAEAVALMAERGDHARVLAGGTDLIVQLREGRCDADLVVDVKHVAELNVLDFDPRHGLRLGAAVPCWRLCEHPAVVRAYPGLLDAAALIGGVQIQSRASVGGNLCNASPAADSIPALIAGEAVCTIAGPKGTRELPAEQFCRAPGKNVLGRGELLVQLRLPAPRPHSGSAYLRFIPRNEMDIAVVGAGVSVTLDETKTRCATARVALAAVAPTPLLVAEAAAALVGSALAEDDFARAAGRAQAAALPISDMRGDAAYRRHLVGILVQRALRTATGRAKEN